MKKKLLGIAAAAGLLVLAACGNPPVTTYSPSGTNASVTFDQAFQDDPANFTDGYSHPIVWVRYLCSGESAWRNTSSHNIDTEHYSDGTLTIAASCGSKRMMQATPQDKHK